MGVWTIEGRRGGRGGGSKMIKDDIETLDFVNHDDIKFLLWKPMFWINILMVLKFC